MKVEYHHICTLFISPNARELEEISSNLSYYTWEYRGNKREKVLKSLLFKVKEKDNVYFTYSGLLPIALNLDKPNYPGVHKEIIQFEKLLKDKMWNYLRDYQQRAIKELLRFPRGILHAPTGSGKTEIMIALCKAIKEVPILIVVPKSQSLLEQTYLRFLKHFGDKEVGYNYGKGTKLGRIMITSPGSAEKLNLNKFQAILGDEIHHAPSLTYKNIFLKAKNAIIRYGFSGTPIGRSDLKDLETIGLTGIITSKIGYQELQEKGFLSSAEYCFVKFNSEELLDEFIWIHSDTTDWHTIVDNYFLYNQTRQAITLELTKQALQKERNVLIIVERKLLGEFLKTEILAFTDSVEFVCSETKGISKIIDAFKRGELKVLIATQLIETGIDIPNLNTIILASIGKSSIQLLQRIGRGLRPKQGKLIIFDLVDTNNEVLYAHALKRKKYILETGMPFTEVEIDTLIIDREIRKLWFKIINK